MNKIKIRGLIILGKAIIIIGLLAGLINSDSSIILTEENLKCRDCNLVIISLTNTRKDHIGIYGYSRDTTPNIDTFFKNSLIFENTFAPASWTLPVSASLFTSLFPYTHGVMDRYDGSMLPDDVLTMTEIFKANGYKTAGFTGGGDYNRVFNIAQGYDFYLDEESYADFDISMPRGGQRIENQAYLSIEKLVPFAIKWLKENKNDKKFLLLHGYDAHCPFTPKKPFDKKYDDDYKGNIDYSGCLWTFERTEPIYENGIRYWYLKSWYTKNRINEVKMTDRDIEHMIALYDGEINQADSYLKDFFRAVRESGMEKNTIFIFMSEHGDLFGEHGRFMRGGPLRGTFYEPVLNFPLLIKHPKINRAVKIDSLIQTVDLMPTIIEFFNLKDRQEAKREGKSMIPAIVERKEINEYVYAASRYKAVDSVYFSGTSVISAIRNKEWKLIQEEVFDFNFYSSSYELYRISEDIKEEKNMYNIKSDIAESLKQKLEKWLERKSL